MKGEKVEIFDNDTKILGGNRNGCDDSAFLEKNAEHDKAFAAASSGDVAENNSADSKISAEGDSVGSKISAEGDGVGGANILIDHSNDLGEVRPLKKDGLSRSNRALTFTHAISNITNIFVSTFLVSYIYSISSNYVLNIGLFYMVKYVAMAIFYFLVSFIVDRTNRVIVYRIALFIHGIFMLLVVIWGRNLATYIVLAGLIYGLADALYYASYNVMKNELIPSRKIARFSAYQHSAEKIINVVIPISLGPLIDLGSFKLSAIIVLSLMAVQIVVSLFIYSKRPENSSFNVKEFFQDVKDLGENKSFIKRILLISAIYGFYTILSPLETVLIMLSFDSNFSLGIIKGIFAVCAVAMIFVLTKLLKPGRRNFIYILAAVLIPLSSLIVVIFTSKITLIIYSFVYATFSIVSSYYYDVFRNTLLKKFGMYRDIAEFQCAVELVMNFARGVIFLLMIIAGVIGASFGTAGLVIATKVMLFVSVFSLTSMDILLLFMEKKLIKQKIIE